MEISAIKTQLSLSTILQYYGLKPDKNAKMCCPFHEDKTPSMQVYYKTQTAYCFSSNCKTHGKSMDVIDFIMHKENLSKHEAIKKAEDILNPSSGNQEISREQFLNNMFQYFRNAISNSKPAKEYLEKRNLDNSILEIGYNSGQFHHGGRKTEELLKQALEVGLLQDKGQINSRTGEKGFSPFAKWCICFALRNQKNEVTGLYFRSILNDDKAKHYYLKNRSGIYPGYPKKETKKLILTEAIIDCASLLQIKEIRDNYSLINCFGTNGLNEEILNTIKSLENLEEIIFCFDNDEAGNKAVQKYAEIIKSEHLLRSQTVTISLVELPNNDINETLQLHDENIFLELLNNRKGIFLSTEKIKITVEKSAESAQSAREEKAEPKTAIDFLSQKELLKALNQLIEKSGIIGEENSRLLLFLITISYLNKSPLHGIVQGSSGSEKRISSAELQT